MQKSTDGGKSFTTVKSDGVVPPYNIGPRSISDPVVGLGAASYADLAKAAITKASTGEKFFAEPIDDPFLLPWWHLRCRRCTPHHRFKTI